MRVVSVTQSFDALFRVTSRSVNGANTVAFTYDRDNLLQTAGAESLSYDALNGYLTGTALGLATEGWSYNGFGETAGYSAAYNGIGKYAASYERDKLGRIVKKTETVLGSAHVFDYAYDTAGRLTSVLRDGASQGTYSYDANGNRLANGAMYDAQDRLTATASATYAYTANGELLTKTTAGGAAQYTYDVLGNLKKVVLAGGTVVEYVTDGRNRRIARYVNGGYDKGWAYKDGLNPVAEVDVNGAVTALYVYASRSNVPDYLIKGGVTYKIVSDHLGSPRLVMDVNTGAVVQDIEYDVWGNVLHDTNPGFIPFGFAGGLYDQATHLLRFGARDYDPEIGRWTSKDPIRFRGGMNMYGYVLADPVNLVDPSGLLSPNLHFQITYRAALDAGVSPAKSLDLAWKTMMVDLQAGSQDESPESTKRHGMSSIEQTRDNAYNATGEYIESSMRSGNYGDAIHAAQDLATPGHAGQRWHGFKPDKETAEHVIGDLFPSKQTLNDAYQRTVEIIRIMQRRQAGFSGACP